MDLWYDEEEEDLCPHGISYDEPCEKCDDEEDYEFDLDTAPPSKAYPRMLDIDPDELPF